MLSFLDNPQIDYITTDNKLMQCSAILDIKEIPIIPNPDSEIFSIFPQKSKRSVSLSSREEKLKKLYPLFLAKQRYSKPIQFTKYK